MAFTLFLCGPRVAELSAAAPAIVEELAARGVDAQVLGGGWPALEAALAAMPEGKSALVLVSEPSRARRAELWARRPEAVVVDWLGEDSFEPTASPHLSLARGKGTPEGLGEVLALLEGLGYLPFSGSYSGAQEEELVGRLKDLGYV
ncbi:MAG: hypothetical protein HYZ28_05500 [Myxococcales bacterium]|nr:hypothetical protein [Myxococcales bacterium]